MFEAFNSWTKYQNANLVETWNSWDKQQKIVLTIYAIVSLPLLPFTAIIIPFAHWITQPNGVPPRKLTLIEFLSMSIAISIFGYLIFAVVLL
jgi:hypothetical protein